MTDPISSSGGSATAGPSKSARPQPPPFRPATSFLPPNASASASGSLRNASGSSTGGSAGPTPPEASESSGSSNPGTSNGDASTPAAGAEGAAAAPAAPAGPVKPVHRSASSKNAIIYSAVQRRNPVLTAIKNVPTEIGDIPADYQVGTHNGVLYLSLKYHRLHPEYIHSRIEKMKGMYQLRILMILCDVTEHQQSLRELTKIAIVNNLSTIVAWSNDEIGQYLATFKQFEHKSADTLKEKVHQTYHDQLQHVLTSGKKVNKTDAFNMASQFGSFANISSQSAKMIATVKGLGPTKVTTLVDAFTKPFLVGGLKRSAPASGSTETASSGSAAVSRGGGSSGRSAAAHKGKSKGRSAEPIQVEDEERVGSPDWPSGSDDDDEAAVNTGAGKPDRTPKAGANGSGTAKGLSSEVWQDPLDEDEEDTERVSDEGNRAGKRQRVE